MIPMLILLTSLGGKYYSLTKEGKERKERKSKKKKGAKAPSTGILRKIMVFVEHKQATFIIFKKIFKDNFY